VLSMSDLTDTKDKIQAQMKDHDILIGLYTLYQEMSRRLDDTIKSNNEILTSLRSEVRAISDNEIRLDGRMKALEQSQCDLQGHVDKLQSRNTWLDAAGIIGAIIAAAIAWFR
jgi:hypothetical protein